MPTQVTIDIEKNKIQYNGVDFTDVPVRVVAAYNPVVIQFQRKDWIGTSQESGAIAGKQAFDIGSLSSELEVGDKIWANFGPISSSVGFDVINKTGNVITINFPWSFGAQAGYLNILTRKNWYLTLKVISTDFSNQERILKLTPTFSGIIRAEISGALQSFMDLKFSPVFLSTANPAYTINLRDLDLGKAIGLQWKENWIGSEEVYTSTSNQFSAIAGAFNIGNPNNGFYTDYYPNNFGSSAFPTFLPKWLTVFTRPRYWAGFFFTKSMFLPDGLTGVLGDYQFRRFFKNQSGSTVQALIYVPTFGEGDLNQIEISPANPAVIPDNIKTAELEFIKSSSGQFVIQRLVCNYIPASEIDCNNLYIRWLNPLGGWEYWLFEHNIYEGQRVDSLGLYENYFDQLSSTTSYQNAIGKRTTFVIQAGTDVFDENTAAGLRTLYSSPKVEFLNQDTNVWIGVQVLPGSFQYRKNKRTYNRFEASFELPTEFNQTA